MEDHIPRDKGHISRKIKDFVPFITWYISEKGTRGFSMRKFSTVTSESGCITLTTKSLQMSVKWFFFSKVIQKVRLDRREDEVLLIKYIAVATQSFQ